MARTRSGDGQEPDLQVSGSTQVFYNRGRESDNVNFNSARMQDTDWVSEKASPKRGTVAVEVQVIPPEEFNEQFERIIRSDVFRNANTLQRLLRYVSSKASDGSAKDLKEYTIGVEALDRRPDYDTKTDTIVRVQIHRLRQKLRDYYEGEGVHDKLVIQIPMGHYVPTFELREFVAGSVFVGPSETEEKDHWNGGGTTQPLAPLRESKANPVYRTVSRAQVLGIGAAAIALTFLGFFLGSRWQSKRQVLTNAKEVRAKGTDAVDDDVRNFWGRFLASDPAPIIAYPDPVFLLDDTNDLLRYRHGASDHRGSPVDPHLAQQFASNPQLVAKAGPLFFENGYTGTSAVVGAVALVRVFTQMGAYPSLKRASEITTDDLQHHNLILLGSSSQNIAAAQLPSGGNFIFENPEPHRELWRARIRKQNAQNHETVIYGTERDAVTKVVKSDHSIISMQAGIAPHRYVAILGGLDTTGTEGAALFLTSGSKIGELMKALTSQGDTPANDEPFLFQALLKVDVLGGDDVFDTQLIEVDKVKAIK